MARTRSGAVVKGRRQPLMPTEQAEKGSSAAEVAETEVQGWAADNAPSAYESPGISSTTMDRQEALLPVAPNRNYAHLGELLIVLRRSYPVRRGLTAHGEPEMKLTAKALASCLNRAGYSMTSGSYSMLEQGKSLPKNPPLFFAKIEQCLALDPTGNEARLLRELYLKDYALRVMDSTHVAAVQVRTVQDKHSAALAQ